MLRKLLRILGSVRGSKGDPMLIEAVSRHVDAAIGPPAIFHELWSGTIHVDIYSVPPSEDRPFCTLITSGMAEKPMSTPAGYSGPRYLELIMFLPEDWPMDRVTSDEVAFW